MRWMLNRRYAAALYRPKRLEFEAESEPRGIQLDLDRNTECRGHSSATMAAGQNADHPHVIPADRLIIVAPESTAQRCEGNGLPYATLRVASSLQVNGDSPGMALGDRSTVRKANEA
jgi:hypothetical protein